MFIRFLLILIRIEDDSYIPLVCWENGDAFVLFQFFECLSFFWRGVGRKALKKTSSNNYRASG